MKIWGILPGSARRAPAGKTEQAPAQSETKASPKTPLKEKLVTGAFATSALATALEVGAQVAGVPGVAGKLAAAAIVLGGGAAGYVLSDLASGIFHWVIDNYPDKKTPIVGGMANDFQTHHHFPRSLEASTFLSNCAQAGKVLWIPMALTAIAHPPLAVAAGAFTFLTGAYLAQGLHRCAHMPESIRPKFAKVLQKLHLGQSTPNHLTHHMLPWDDYYCIVNGMWNPILSKANFWRKLENATYKLTGKEPRAWRDPGVKRLAMGEITKEQFLQERGLDRKQFRDVLKNDPEWQKIGENPPSQWNQKKEA